MPYVLAHPHGHSSPLRVERPDRVAVLHEPFLVEQAVRRQEHLPVDMADAPVGATQGRVQRRVVVPVPELFVEADRDVHRRRGGEGMLRRQIPMQGTSRHGQLANTALQEVPRQCGFRKDDEAWWSCEPGGLREDPTDTPQVPGVVTLDRPDLRHQQRQG